MHLSHVLVTQWPRLIIIDTNVGQTIHMRCTANVCFCAERQHNYLYTHSVRQYVFMEIPLLYGPLCVRSYFISARRAPNF